MRQRRALLPRPLGVDDVRQRLVRHLHGPRGVGNAVAVHGHYDGHGLAGVADFVDGQRRRQARRDARRLHDGGHGARGGGQVGRP